MSFLILDSDTTVGTSPASSSYARMLMQLLPPGELWRLVSSTLSSFFLACADELGRLDARTIDLRNEADPSTALELLPEYERELRLEVASTVGERRARIVARRVARQRSRPVDFQTALSTLLALAPASVVVIERSAAFAASLDDAREIYRFFIYRDPSLPGVYFLASAQQLVDQIAPSHTIGTVIESISFLYDDPHSLHDRDLMGA